MWSSFLIYNHNKSQFKSNRYSALCIPRVRFACMCDDNECKSRRSAVVCVITQRFVEIHYIGIIFQLTLTFLKTNSHHSGLPGWFRLCPKSVKTVQNLHKTTTTTQRFEKYENRYVVWLTWIRRTMLTRCERFNWFTPNDVKQMKFHIKK